MAKQCWLVKQEPEAYSWSTFVKEGRTQWTGVRNFQARNNLRAMKKGDLVFFYHSVTDKQIVGVAKVDREFYPDPSDESGKFCMCDFKAVKPLKRPISLAEVKATPALAKMSLLTSARLSVQPVRDDEWKLICKMGGV